MNFFLFLMDTQQTEYAQCSDAALKVLISFCRGYLCETALSPMIVIKSNYQTRLILETDLGPKLKRSYQISQSYLGEHFC